MLEQKEEREVVPSWMACCRMSVAEQVDRGILSGVSRS